MKLFGVPISVHTRKVILAARFKSIPYELQVVVPVVPTTLPPNWREISPAGFVPAIQDGEFRLADSTAIVQYLERKQPEPALLPTDAKQLGSALSLDAWAGSELFSKVVRPLFHNQIVFPKIRKSPGDQSAIDKALLDAEGAFGYLEQLRPQTFLVGEKFSIADIAVMANLIMFHYLGHHLDTRFAKLNAYFRRHLESQMVQEILDAEIPFVVQMGLDRSFLVQGDNSSTNTKAASASSRS